VEVDDDNEATLLLAVDKPLEIEVTPDESEATELLVLDSPDDSEPMELVVDDKPDDSDVTRLFVVESPLEVE
ncbi:hypothetical protein, partial [Burkholderia gladioli]|uniref:hypothetical protein n=1 Tax=Burkholderia gladioli TaxID=28095 RepID=UPI002445F70D